VSPKLPRTGAALKHDPEKACPDLIRGGYRFSEKIMLKQQPKIISL
jgi:hypothetical protein